MSSGVHGESGVRFPDLPDYAARVKAFNAARIKLREYVRVMVEKDVTPKRPAIEIVRKRADEVHDEGEAIKALM